MILTLGNTKGGTGKSTLSVQFAIHRSRNHSVLLVDGDEQQSAMDFTNLRSVEDYTAIRLTGSQIHRQVKLLVKNYDDVIIDCGGRDTTGFRAALTITNLLLIPVQPRTFDIWAMESVMLLVAEARPFNPEIQCRALLNLADTQCRDNESARQQLSEYGIKVIEPIIQRRKVYSDSIGCGKGIAEMKPRNKKAIDELNAVIESVYGESI